jgi:hypothetical protein
MDFHNVYATVFGPFPTIGTFSNQPAVRDAKNRVGYQRQISKS